MGNEQGRGGDANYEYGGGGGGGYGGGYGMVDYVQMYNDGAKNDSATYLKEYPNDALDDPRKDKNWMFYSNKITNMGDSELATVEQMHAWHGDHEKLERYHDYIQWLFPLHDPSLFNKKISLLQRHEVRKIRRDPKASERVVKSYEMLLDFYGFVLDRASGRVSRKATGAILRLNSLNTVGNHNFRRISRILKSLGDLGFERYQLPLLLRFAEEIYQHRTLSCAQSSFENYWKVFCIGESNRQALERAISVFKGESRPPARTDTPAALLPQFVRAGPQTMLGTPAPIKLAHVAATGHNWVGLYKVGQLDEDVGNRALSIPPVAGSKQHVDAGRALADNNFPPSVRQALAIQRRHVPHFQPQLAAGREIRRDQVKPCAYGTHSGMSALVVMHPNVTDSAVVGQKFTFSWKAAPYAKTIYGGPNVEIVVMLIADSAGGSCARTLTTLVKSTPLKAEKWVWKVPKKQPLGFYFACLRSVGYAKKGGVEHAGPTNGGFKVVAAAAMPKPVQLAAQLSSERRTSAGTHGIITAKVPGELTWPAERGAWGAGTYEYRYFEAGWHADSNSLLFVPARGPAAVSKSFTVPAIPAGAATVLPVQAATPPPPTSALESTAWLAQEAAHRAAWKKKQQEIAEREAAWEAEKQAAMAAEAAGRARLLEAELAAGLERGVTRGQVLYQGTWYEGTFSKTQPARDGSGGLGVHQIQCDVDAPGTFTNCFAKDFRIASGTVSATKTVS